MAAGAGTAHPSRPSIPMARPCRMMGAVIVMRVTRTPSRPRIMVGSEAAAAELEAHGVAERLDPPPGRVPPLRPARPARR